MCDNTYLTLKKCKYHLLHHIFHNFYMASRNILVTFICVIHISVCAFCNLKLQLHPLPSMARLMVWTNLLSLQWNTVVSSYTTARLHSMLTPQYHLLCCTVILHGTALWNECITISNLGLVQLMRRKVIAITINFAEFREWVAF